TSPMSSSGTSIPCLPTPTHRSPSSSSAFTSTASSWITSTSDRSTSRMAGPGSKISRRQQGRLPDFARIHPNRRRAKSGSWTRLLGTTLPETERFRAELLADEKERAEHYMLLDLARNDLGKVCRFGTVKVPQRMTVERYSHVQHLVSRVEGELAPGNDALDAFAAVFPAGTVSGAPKPRAMEILHDLEGTARGPYAGVVGYLSLNGNVDTAIAIRTLFADGPMYYLQAGAGIVADSDPAREWFETEHKLEGLRAALREAVA